MTGGMAYLYDPDGLAFDMMNLETVVTVPVNEGHYMDELERLVERHLAETGSQKAAAILQHWDDEKDKFVQVVPKRDAEQAGGSGGRVARGDSGGIETVFAPSLRRRRTAGALPPTPPGVFLPRRMPDAGVLA